MAKQNGSLQRVKVDITYLVEMPGGFAVGSGFRRGLIQKTVLRDERGFPLLPASMLKGRTRDTAERLIKTLGEPACESSPHPAGMCGVRTSRESACLVCSTFGTPGRSSNSNESDLIWRDARLIDEKNDYLDENLPAAGFFSERTHVQISRRRGVAMEKRLFNEEAAIEKLRYEGRIRGWLAVNSEQYTEYPEEVLFLISSLKLTNFVGGSKSRGLGGCEVMFRRIAVGDKRDIRLDEIINENEKWIRNLKGAAE